MTQTMRERLEAAAKRTATVNYEDGYEVDNWSEVIDALLAELRDRDKPMILAGLDSFKLAMAEEPRPGILADAFTTMIDAVREGK